MVEVVDAGFIRLSNFIRDSLRAQPILGELEDLSTDELTGLLAVETDELRKRVIAQELRARGFLRSPEGLLALTGLGLPVTAITGQVVKQTGVPLFARDVAVPLFGDVAVAEVGLLSKSGLIQLAKNPKAWLSAVSAAVAAGGFSQFTNFIGEEALQTANFNVRNAIIVKDPVLSREALNLFNDILGVAETQLGAIGAADRLLGGTFRANLNAQKFASKIYEASIVALEEGLLAKSVSEREKAETRTDKVNSLRALRAMDFLDFDAAGSWLATIVDEELRIKTTRTIEKVLRKLEAVGVKAEELERKDRLKAMEERAESITRARESMETPERETDLRDFVSEEQFTPALESQVLNPESPSWELYDEVGKAYQTLINSIEPSVSAVTSELVRRAELEALKQTEATGRAFDPKDTSEWRNARSFEQGFLGLIRGESENLMRWNNRNLPIEQAFPNASRAYRRMRSYADNLKAQVSVFN